MPAECQRMPESWHNCFSATNAHTEQKNKKALDNHMWRDHQKETYVKCRLCWFTDSHYDNLKKHITVVHRKEK